MRMKMIQAWRAIVRWMRAFLEVQLPMDALLGLRTPGL